MVNICPNDMVNRGVKMRSLRYIYVYTGRIEWAIFCKLNNTRSSINPNVSPFRGDSVGIAGFDMVFNQ